MGAVSGESHRPIIPKGEIAIVPRPHRGHDESQLLEEVVEGLVPDSHSHVPEGRNDIEGGVFSNHVEAVLPEVVLHQTGGVGIDDANPAPLSDSLIIAGHLAGQLSSLLHKVAEVPRSVFIKEGDDPSDVDGSATLEDLCSEGREAQFEDIPVGRLFIHIEQPLQIQIDIQ